MPQRGEKPDGEAVRADRSGVGFLLNQAARSVRARLAEDLRHHDLSDTDFILLRAATAGAAAGSDGISPAQIATDLNMPVAEVASSADRLVRLGWLVRKRAADEVRLRPTQKAVTVVPGITATARWTLEQALNGFSREEIGLLQEMLERIIRNTGASS